MQDVLSFQQLIVLVSFTNWKVKNEHQHRLTVATHRGQENFCRAVMGFRNSPAYVQRKIDTILRAERTFARSYIDDIVIFSRTFEEHLEHLKAVFQKLKSFKIVLSAKKCFLGYPSVGLLGQRVDALGLASAKGIQNVNLTNQLAYPVSIVQVGEEWINKLKVSYKADQRCSKLIELLESNGAQGENAAVLPFKYTRGILYAKEDETHPRVRSVIPKNMEGEVFSNAHDQLGHLGYDRTQERLSSNFYIFDIGKKLRTFLYHCHQCRVSSTPRHLP